jgi:uncharacterized membrane protein
MPTSRLPGYTIASIVGREIPAVKRGRSRLGLACVLLLVGAYALGFSVLALRYHDAFLTYAEDLGLTDQIVWNTVHGRPWAFTFYDEAAFTLDIDPRALKHPDSLLAYHVEPLLLLVVPFYLLWSSPKTLLVLQASVVASGVLATYWLARQRLQSEAAGLGFALVYALLPPFQSGLLDFHTVTLASPLLLFAAAGLASGRTVGFAVSAALAVAAREELGVSVALLSLYGACCWGRRRVGLTTAVLALGWSLVSITIILPAHTGNAPSPFLTRYALLGLSEQPTLEQLVALPWRAWQAATRPEARDYVLYLARAHGFLPLAAPLASLVAVPALLLNILSTSGWMVEGKAHYSAIVAALLLVAAIEGARAVVWRWQHPVTRARPSAPVWRTFGAVALTPTGAPGRAHHAVLAWVVAWGIIAQVTGGRAPIGRYWQWPAVGTRERLTHELLHSIPTTAAVSAQTTLAPHLSQRQEVYLFPTLRDAEYVLLDRRATQYPVEPAEYHAAVEHLLADPCFEVLVQEDDLLLLRRTHAPCGLPGGPPVRTSQNAQR